MLTTVAYDSLAECASLVRLPGVDHFSIIDPRSPAFDTITGAISNF